jgi:hypothetical protein
MKHAKEMTQRLKEQQRIQRQETNGGKKWKRRRGTWRGQLHGKRLPV